MQLSEGVRIGIISDVHANVDALAAVLRALEERGVREVVSLGDVVGYNAFPRETIALMRKAKVSGVRGNHDLMVLGKIPASSCGPRGQRAVAWTAAEITLPERAYLEALPVQIRRHDSFLFVHSRLGDPVGRMQTPADFVTERRFLGRQYPRLRVCFTGHTHEQVAIEITKQGGFQRHLNDVALDPESFYFVNPGSVGEPRIADYRAAFAIYDGEQRTVSFHRVEYDRSRVLQENTRRGLSRRKSRIKSLAARVLVRARTFAAQVIPGYP
ncbi:MAG: metallophosphoesterase family protein [Gemmatimonadetes bacterium]|nr:metallophosphoesterase family protein [Gemmatimonadota bacterium]